MKKFIYINNHTAFSFIEVAIVLAIIGVLLTLAVPNISRIMASNQATEQSHNFISAISLTLSEASKNDTAASICAKKEGSNDCVNYTNNPSSDIWRHGWLIFTDRNNTGTYDPSNGDELIRTQVNGTNKINVSAAASSVTISSSGIVTRGAGEYFFSPNDCINSGHKVTVYNTGQISVKGGTCP